MRSHTHQQGESTIVEFHHHAFERFLWAFNRHFQQLQNHGLVFAQHFARGDAEQQGVTDLTSSASNGDANGFLAHGKLLRVVKKRTGTQREVQHNPRF